MTRQKTQNRGRELAKLALAGVLGGTLALGTAACSSDTSQGASDSGQGTPTADAGGAQYAELHDCAGMNSCKGLGGCKVSSEKLAGLASARGIDVASAGAAHDCKGLNECKGLGGCSVDAAKLEKLKAMKDR